MSKLKKEIMLKYISNVILTGWLPTGLVLSHTKSRTDYYLLTK